MITKHGVEHRHATRSVGNKTERTAAAIAHEVKKVETIHTLETPICKHKLTSLRSVTNHASICRLGRDRQDAITLVKAAMPPPTRTETIRILPTAYNERVFQFP